MNFKVIKGDNKGYEFVGEYYKDSWGGEWVVDTDKLGEYCTKKFYSFDEVELIK